MIHRIKVAACTAQDGTPGYIETGGIPGFVRVFRVTESGSLEQCGAETFRADGSRARFYGTGFTSENLCLT